jgi:SnoaL-like domain/Sigma-70 region 2
MQTPRRPGTERTGRQWHAGVVEQATLQRARAGDEQAFRELTDPYRRELQVHCYRMLGSLADAEDMLQETLAGMLSTSQTAVKGTLQRARAALDQLRGQDARTLRPGSASEQALARRFAEAYVAADIDGVIALLTDDAWLSMPPAPHQYHGTAAIRSFLQASFGYRGERHVYLLPVQANRQPALASYLTGPGGASASPAGLLVLTMAGLRIRAITRFHCDELYPRFGVPRSLPEPAAHGTR